MVNVALLISLTSVWLFISCAITPGDFGWYKKMVKHYRTGGKRKKLLSPSPWWFKVIWAVASLTAVIALYIYFDGNCHFDQPRIYREDDETDEPGWIRGIIVLVFSLTNCWLKYKWVETFFRKRIFRLACIILLIMVILNVVTLWAMATTEPCKLDSVDNRYWICFGLYLVYTVWLLFLGFFNVSWMRNVGGKLNKKCDDYIDGYKKNKCQHYVHKKRERYGQSQYLKEYYPRFNVDSITLDEENLKTNTKTNLGTIYGGLSLNQNNPSTTYSF